MAHLIYILDIPVKSVFLTMLYVPHPVRPEGDIIGKMGNILAQLSRWQVSFVLQTESSTLEVTSKLGTTVTAAHAGAEQCDYERMVISRGCTLNSLNIIPPMLRIGADSVQGGQSQGQLVARDDSGAASTAGSSSSPAEKATSGASSSSRTHNRAFSAPRRIQDSPSASSALEDRASITKARLAAEALEEEADRNAAQQAKKARTGNTAPGESKGTKKTKKKASSKEGQMSMDDIPDVDQ